MTDSSYQPILGRHELTVVVKEGNEGRVFLALEPGSMCLHFREPVSYERAKEIARFLRHTFTIETDAPYYPPLNSNGPEDGGGPAN